MLHVEHGTGVNDPSDPIANTDTVPSVLAVYTNCPFGLTAITLGPKPVLQLLPEHAIGVSVPSGPIAYGDTVLAKSLVTYRNRPSGVSDASEAPSPAAQLLPAQLTGVKVPSDAIAKIETDPGGGKPD